MTTNRLVITLAIFCTAFILQTGHAGEKPTREHTANFTGPQLPAVNHAALIELLGTLRSQLIQQKQDLQEDVADKHLDSGDAIITVIMPGGLLYAGYKKARLEQAKSELARVSADIKEYTNDLLAMQSLSAPIVVAQLH